VSQREVVALRCNSAVGIEEGTWLRRTRLDAWHLDVVVAGAQKCLGGPPGISLCVVGEDAWAAIDANPSAPRGTFVSLLDWRETWLASEGAKFPYTPSVSDMYGAHAAISECLDHGLDVVIERHAAAARACRAGVEAMGLELWPRSHDYAANCVTAVRCPEGVGVAETLAHVRDRYGVMLSGGYGELADKLFRIGHMGSGSRSLYPLVSVSALARGLADLGVTVDVGAAAAATLESLSAAGAVVTG